MKFRILIVDDEPEVCSTLSEILNDNGYDVRSSVNPAHVLSSLTSHPVDLILLDIRMPEIGGIDLLEMIRKEHPVLGIIVISGYATVEHAVKAMKYGAINLLVKPVKIPILLQEIQQYARSVKSKNDISTEGTIITANNRMLKILEQVKVAAHTNAPILICGESGTGKEMVADLVHKNSNQSLRPLIKINCAAIPENLLESELFGYEKGAFTDAKETKRGLLEYADQGTVFFDEIGDMSLHTQAKMLRVLQDKHFTRVGGIKELNADFRIIAATNKNLQEGIEKGIFREDLYYRLAVVDIKMPPLRDRQEDILELTAYFIQYFNSVYEKDIKGVSREVSNVLSNHLWPGNIRELKNVIERAVIFAFENIIDLSCLPDQYKTIVSSNGSGELFSRYDSISREIILEALSRTNGVRQDAARILKISRKTLYNRMRRLNIL